ncbi:hypothetical protein Tco_0674826 [Tanacetum coccineum]
MLRASRVQIPQNNLDNLQSIKEEYGTSEIVDPQDYLGSLVLEVLDSTILTLLLDPTDLDTFGFLLYTLSSGDVVITGVIVDSLRGTSLMEVILVKGHLFPTIVNILPVGFQLYPISVNALPIGFDPLALVVVFTPVAVNKGLLESLVLRESVCLGMLLENMTSLINLTFLSLFIGVTATNFSQGFVKIGHVLET